MVGVPQHLEKSRECALGLDNPTHLIRANITLSIPVAESGDLQRAYALLDEAEALQPVSYVDDYMIAHNRLVTECSPRRLRRQLLAAGRSVAAGDRFMDRVLIANILLAAATLLGDAAAADRFASVIRDCWRMSSNRISGAARFSTAATITASGATIPSRAAFGTRPSPRASALTNIIGTPANPGLATFATTSG